MTKKELFVAIKEANSIVDRANGLDTHSKQYADLMDSLYWILESIQFGYHPWYSLHLSNRTGHYYIKFS